MYALDKWTVAENHNKGFLNQENFQSLLQIFCCMDSFICAYLIYDQTVYFIMEMNIDKNWFFSPHLSCTLNASYSSFMASVACIIIS